MHSILRDGIPANNAVSVDGAEGSDYGRLTPWWTIKLDTWPGTPVQYTLMEPQHLLVTFQDKILMYIAL